MKAGIIGAFVDVEKQEWWAVVLPAADAKDPEGRADAPPSVVAVFLYPDQATRWAEQNYAGRFKVSRIVWLPGNPDRGLT